MSEALAIEPVTRPCVICSTPYEPKSRVQVTCGSTSCREKQNYRRQRADPATVEKMRARFDRWYAAKTGKPVKTNPWLAAAPAYGPFLPGGAVELRVDPFPKWPVLHRNVRGLHGMVSDLTGHDHQQVPQFALMPTRTRFGWAVYVREEERARALAGRSHAAILYDRPTTVTTSLLFRFRTPPPPRRGHQRVRVEAITPVCIRNDGNSTYTKPTAENFISTLGRQLAPRLGVAILTDALRVEVVESETEPATVQLGGKYGDVRGWTGSVVLEVNAPAAWLLRCSAQIGLGGRVSMGFGRVVVGDIE